MFDSSLWHENATPAPDLDFENVYDNLANLHAQPYLEPTDGIAMSSTIGFENKLHPALAEYADEHYMELSDIGFAGEGNLMEALAPVDYLCPFASVPSSFGPDNSNVDNDVDTYLASESQ